MAKLDRQNRPSKIEVLPDGRYLVTDFFDVLEHELKNLTKFEADVKIAVATAHPVYTGCRLIKQEMGDPSLKPSVDRHIWIRVYEQLSATTETQVGLATKVRLDDGRDAWEYTYRQFSANVHAPGTIGTDTAPDNAALFLMKVEAPDDGTVRTIKRTYVDDGLLDQQDSEDNNGALLKRTLVHAKTAPTAPGGYYATPISTSVKSVNGFPIYTYTYAKGDGEISRRTSRSQCGTTVDGTVGVSRLDIDYLRDPAASEPTWGSVSGYVKIIVTEQEADGHKRWSAIYAKGVGLVAQSIGPGPAGLRRVTNTSLGTKVVPDGVVTDDDYRLADGFTIYTTTSIQTAAGGVDPTSITVSAERYVSFTYPGRAKAFTETFDGKLMLASFLSPPVTTQVKATVTVSYVTTPTLGTIADFWNPTEWATIKQQWVGAYGKQTSLIRALPGYRSVSATPVTHTGTGTDSSIEGSIIYNGTEASITITGGPADPGGDDLTLDAQIDTEPVFTTADGATKYYRKTLITASIPAQSALPV